MTKGLFETTFSEDKRFVVVGKALDDKKNKYDYSLYHLNGQKSNKIWSENNIKKKKFYFSPNSNILLMVDKN